MNIRVSHTCLSMLQLLPKDVVDYIYTILHKSNTQAIINEYRHKTVDVDVYLNSRANLNEDNIYIRVLLHEDSYTFNYRSLRYIYNRYIYRNHTIQCDLPRRY